ncbi:hypothetical protein EDB80DRAFT_714984 [Ilyonectria destructans]|nr:hypothetical protein EDB80DRAFT_714984 [Ilyonectria destructans]
MLEVCLVVRLGLLPMIKRSYSALTSSCDLSSSKVISGSSSSRPVEVVISVFVSIVHGLTKLSGVKTSEISGEKMFAWSSRGPWDGNGLCQTDDPTSNAENSDVALWRSGVGSSGGVSHDTYESATTDAYVRSYSVSLAEMSLIELMAHGSTVALTVVGSCGAGAAPGQDAPWSPTAAFFSLAPYSTNMLASQRLLMKGDWGGERVEEFSGLPTRLSL